ncbi:MAG: hypothetical protein CMO01_26740 [Thalassobius sp.]|nr:hypothetical protein [Thalassovita sp.]
MKPGFTLLFLIFITTINAFSQVENSELATESIYKIAVVEDGVYKIDATLLEQLGINVSSTEPENIRILGYGSGMLPQANSADRYEDLPENPVKVVGGGDGGFSSSDYILFFGRGAHKIYYDSVSELFQHEMNLYADTNYYFLKIDSEPSLKIQTVEESSSASATITYYDEVIHHELDETNLLNISSNMGGSGSGSGRRWFGERFDFLLNYDFSYEVTGIKENSEINLTAALLSTSPNGGEFDISYNGSNVGNVSLATITANTYGVKGRLSEKTYNFTANNLSSIDVSFEFDKSTSSSKDAGYIDYFTIQYLRKNAIYNSQTVLRSIESLQYNYSKFSFAGLTSDFEVWNITNPENVFQVKLNKESSATSFVANTETVQEFVAFDGSEFKSPVAIGQVTNQNLHNLGAANLIIVTVEDFRQQATRLADFRKSHDNLSSHVVTAEEIYNEYSSGKQDITAIRDFVKFIYDKSSGSDSLKYVLLFGDGSYDYKNRTDETVDGNLIPVYESYESLYMINSYSSDDFFGFMDEDEGEWLESSAESSDLELGIGRLPVNTVTEAQNLVDKLIRYSSSKETLGNWRDKVVLVADDGDANTHQNQADSLGVLINKNYEVFNVNRVFVDAYPQIVSSTTGKTLSPVVRAEINKKIDSGVLIMNYSGHGAESGWADEQILTDGQIVNWDNAYKMPLFVTATCEFGRYDNPNLTSGAEFAILNANGGAIALVTTTRPVYSYTNFELNNAFYNAVFEPIDGEMPRLGDIQRKTKNGSLSGVSNRNFSLLGDPSMMLAYPEDDVLVTSIKNKNQEETDTLKALDYIQIEGEVRRDNALASNFEGVADITVYDKPSTITTYGEEGSNTVMEFDDQRTIIYKGTAIVSNGKFQSAFVVPKDISYAFDFGKISIYAQDTTNFRDASGDVSDLIIGGTASYDSDNEAPELSVYLEDESFENGSIVPANTTLYADVFDDNGINVTGNGIGHDITAVLDNETEYELNDYYYSVIDDYQNGYVAFPLEELEVGLHTLTMKVWDNYNNSSEKTIEFKVVNTDEGFVFNLVSSPNPFSSSTTISFFNALSGEELEIDVNVYDVTGKLVNSFNNSITNSPSNVNIAEWNGSSFDRKKVKGGLYIFKVYLYYPKSGHTYNGIIKVFYQG